MWIETPDKAGYWLFKGIRITRARGFLVSISAPVHVKDDKAYPEMTVFYPGSGMVYKISQHEGKWFWLGDLLND